MADKEDESNMTAGAEEGESSSAAPLHRVAGLAHSGDPVVPDSTHNASSNGEELTSAVKDSAENPVIGEYFQGSVEKGAELGQDDQVASPTAGDGLLLERHIITSFVETPGIETVTTADLSSVNSELVDTSSEATTTIIYVQPDGSFVEGTGLTAEEQRQLVEQLAQQQLVEVTENEAARLFQQQRPPTSHFSHGGALAPNELQQVIDQVSRSQQSVAQVELHGGPAPAQRQEQVPAVSEQLPGCISLPPGCVLTAGSPAQDAAVRPPPLCIVQNASQQLQNVAKQVALQQSQSNNGTRLIQKKQLETIRIQVPIPPPQQEARKCPAPPLALLQQRVPPTGHAPKAGVPAPQIIHITPVIGQQQYLLTTPGTRLSSSCCRDPPPWWAGPYPCSTKYPYRPPSTAELAARPHSWPRPGLPPPPPAEGAAEDPEAPEGGGACCPWPPPLGSRTDTPTGSASTLALAGHSSSTSTSQISSDPTEPVPVTTSDVAPSTAQREKVDPLPLQGALAPGPGRPKGRAGRPRSTARSVRRGRPGRPPKISGALQPPQRRARLKEVLQVCDDEDLMEMVLPRLARVMTVWEFLLMKVDKGRPTRPQFSDVYREFEQLHAQVKKMAQEHLSSTHGPGPHTVLEVRDPQVCQSLGIGDLVTRLQTAPSEKPAMGNLPKNAKAREDCKALPPAKRFKVDPCNTEPNGTFLTQNRTAPTAAGVDSFPGSVEQIPLKDRCLVTGSLSPEESATEVLGCQRMELSSHPQNPLALPPPQAENSAEETASSTDPAGSAPSHTQRAEPGQGVELNGCDMADEKQKLEQVLGSDVVPLDHSYRASRAEVQAVCLGGTVRQTLGDSVELQEQVFIQTEEGLILPGGVLASDRIVIVTSPDGTTMHIRTPDTVPLETVPLETVQALLGIDMGAQPEGVLVSENHP
ncbi:hypothetical protein ANANG_G00001690 [Anguilla anguilla]|uniref:DUF4764 domain-containing protein n=1 Tax=Anguilla anguilla TaxID=7936 RepID=A0A9D3S541_ANGAN|nr:hypothetical protein ANANG_G00001690 [Anguilla anguilla]